MSGEAQEEGSQASQPMTTASDPKQDTNAHPEVNLRVITTRIHSSTSVSVFLPNAYASIVLNANLESYGCGTQLEFLL